MQWALVYRLGAGSPDCCARCHDVCKDFRTMMIHTHVLNRGGKGVKSPADTL